MYNFKRDDRLLDWISNLINDKLYFGPCPSQAMINQLFENNFNLIINLMEIGECNKHSQKILPPPGIVQSTIETLYYPIKDRIIPENSIDYCILIYKICSELDKNKKIYINCMGGHGRSSTVCTSVICCLFGYDLNTSIDMITKSHNSRIVLRERWCKRKYPMNYNQYMFLVKIHRNIFVDIEKNNLKLFSNEPEILRNISINELKDKSILEISTILYNIFTMKLSKNIELNYKTQLTFFRKIIIVNCDNIVLCKIYTEVLKYIRKELHLKCISI
jgi:hypothetical protein